MALQAAPAEAEAASYEERADRWRNTDPGHSSLDRRARLGRCSGRRGLGGPHRRWLLGCTSNARRRPERWQSMGRGEPQPDKQLAPPALRATYVSYAR